MVTVYALLSTSHTSLLVVEGQHDDFQWMAQRRGQGARTTRISMGGYPQGHDRSNKSGKYNVITGELLFLSSANKIYFDDL